METVHVFDACVLVRDSKGFLRIIELRKPDATHTVRRDGSTAALMAHLKLQNAGVRFIESDTPQHFYGSRHRRQGHHRLLPNFPIARHKTT